MAPPLVPLQLTKEDEVIVILPEYEYIAPPLPEPAHLSKDTSLKLAESTCPGMMNTAPLDDDEISSKTLL